MKRRNAILLGSAFLLVVAGYVAWCWRGFYLSPIKYHDEPVTEVVSLAERWTEDTGANLRFDGYLALRALADPWLKYYRYVVVSVNHPAPDLMDIRIHSDGMTSTYRYVRIHGNWLDEREVR